MTLCDDIAADCAAAWFDPTGGLARTVHYHRPPIPALVSLGQDPNTERSPGNLGGSVRMLTQRATLVVQAADVAAPAEGDTWTLDGNTWTVKAITGGNKFSWQLECYRA